MYVDMIMVRNNARVFGGSSNRLLNIHPNRDRLLPCSLQYHKVYNGQYL
jgi:hypothetical protein